MKPGDVWNDPFSRKVLDMIIFDSFSFTYPGMDTPALRDISLRIEEGEMVLLRGPSGSGKSTLLYALNGLIPHVFAGKTHGDVLVNGLNPSGVPVREMARVVGTVFQNPESQIFMMRVADDVAFGCENLLMPREEIISRRDMALRAMDLWHLRHRETARLSGGQKQRLAVSSIYAMGPGVFLFDEPSTDLDDAGRLDFKRIIARLKEEKKTVILAEHQYEDFLPLMDRVITFAGGAIAGESDLNGASADASGRTATYSGLAISLQGIHCGYEPGKSVLCDIHLTVGRGEFVALCGANGSGKTTILKVMGGLLRPNKGTMTILDVRRPTVDALVGRVGFLFQNPDEQLFSRTVAEEIAFGPSQLGKRADVERYLEIGGLKHLRHRHPQTLSRGQRQILAALSVMAMEPDLLLLDEPTTGLDGESWKRLLSLLRNYADTGKTVVFSTHNKTAAAAALRRITMHEGRIIGDEVSR